MQSTLWNFCGFYFFFQNLSAKKSSCKQIIPANLIPQKKITPLSTKKKTAEQDGIVIDYSSNPD